MNQSLSWTIEGIDAAFHEPYASLMKGLVYGLPITIDPLLKQNSVKSGLAHLVVLSGANVTLLTQFSERIFYSFSKRAGLVLQTVFLFGFVCLVGPQAPLMRAVGMFLCTVVCNAAGRPSHMIWNLFLTIIFVAVIYPPWITSVSFQLSVFATVGVVIWGFVSSRFSHKLNVFSEVFFESWFVFLTTTPISLWYFKSISIISPFTTALVSWLVVPLMIAGFAISLSYHILYPVSVLIAIPTQIGLQFIIFIIHSGSSIPFGYINLK